MASGTLPRSPSLPTLDILATRLAIICRISLRRLKPRTGHPQRILRNTIGSRSSLRLDQLISGAGPKVLYRSGNLGKLLTCPAQDVPDFLSQMRLLFQSMLLRWILWGGVVHDENPQGVETETFVIFAPQDHRPPLIRYDSFTQNDLDYIQTYLGIGECLASIHDPAEAASWIEDNWDHPLVKNIRDCGGGGPFAWMLSTEEPALAIFGCYEDPAFANIAKSLAHLSGFSVVIRSGSDNPALTLLTQDNHPHEGYFRFSNTGGGNDEGGRGFDDEGEGMHEDERTPGGMKVFQNRMAGGGGGGGGGGEPGMEDGKWDGPLHRTRVKLQLQLGPAHAYAVTIGCTYKFTINRETDAPIDLNDLTRPLSQPEVIALIDLEIETRPRETQVDRSYANFGFVAHRKESIVQRKFLHRGFELPDKLYKRGQQRQIQRGIKATLGFPDANAVFSYSRNNDNTLEATDSKVMPKCRVDFETGDEWDEDDKSYSSYNIAYQRQEGSEKPLPQISFVNRNQVLIWASDPTSKARIRGIMVLMNSYLDNIRTEEKLSIYEQEQINLETRSMNLPQAAKKENKPGTFSLSIAQVENHATMRSNKLRAGVPAFITKFGQRTSANPNSCIPPHELLARGWDANNNQWRRVLWPALDKNFRAALLEGTPPVWTIQ
ncbi:hypothetical protein MVEN_00896200 [Mycena venus]|uniref:Uncharacterized protein n=1 Tax=Mycena venus TaxID=2733690 RepID=A0A8H6YG01_9AGAR|nr:hypothetical protein MVEN_00896200 [Mycena venus]